MKCNYYTYEGERNTSHTGYFLIYQARDGKIYITMGNNSAPLTKEQIDILGIHVFDLMDFDYDDYQKAYKGRLVPQLQNVIGNDQTLGGVMNIEEFLKSEPSARITNVYCWMIWDDSTEEWVVYGKPMYARITTVHYRGQSLERALSFLGSEPEVEMARRIN